MKKNIVIGLLAGLVSGLFASGGGMILVPAFISILKMDETRCKSNINFRNITYGISKCFVLF